LRERNVRTNKEDEEDEKREGVKNFFIEINFSCPPFMPSIPPNDRCFGQDFRRNINQIVRRFHAFKGNRFIIATQLHLLLLNRLTRIQVVKLDPLKSAPFPVARREI